MDDSTVLSRVWKPLTIGSTTVKNRLMATGHSQLYGQDETVSDRHVAYYRERAKGGAGLLILEQQAVHPAGMAYHAGCLATEPKAIPRYRALAEGVHPHGCKMFVQLFACGSQSEGTLHIDRWHPLWAASRTPSSIYNETPKVMERDDIAEVVDGFGVAAENVAQGGLDGVEVHAAHSQLIGEFLSPHFNRRTDDYGGSLEARCRLSLEVGQEIRRKVGDTLTLGLRLSFDEHLGGRGITPDEAERQLAVLAGAGLYDYFNISAGGYHSLHYAVAPMDAVPEAFMADYAANAKRVVGDRAKIFTVGRIFELETAEKLLANNTADMIALTRAQIADPFLVRKWEEGRQHEVNKCAGINFCIERLVDNREVTCALNPAAGREQAWGAGTLKDATEAPKTISVIGGGPAGMRMAGIAALRGHHVRLYEASSELGGNWRLLSRLPNRSGWKVAINNLERLIERAGVEVTLGASRTAEQLRNADTNAVVLATGATWDATGESPSRPDRNGLPGAELPHVVDIATAAERSLHNSAALGSSVLIVDDGAGYTPFGLSELLADAGVVVEIVSSQLTLGAELLKNLDMQHVFPRLVSKGVTLTSQTFVERVDKGVAVLSSMWGGEPRRAEYDSVVLAMTRTPNDALYWSLQGQDTAPDIHRIGDCVAPRRAAAVVYEGEELGRAI